MIVSGNDVVRHKPDPEGIRKFIDAYSLLPAEVVMVGDASETSRRRRPRGRRP